MKKIINICCVSMCLLGIYLSVYQSIIGTITKEYAISSALMGFIISLHFIGSVVAPIIFGEISDRIGKKPVLITAFCLLIAGLLEVFLFKNLIVISIGIFFIGCGFAVVEGSISGLLADLNTENSGKVMNFAQMFFSIGAVGGPLIAMLTFRQSGSWKTIFIFMIIAFTGITFYISRIKTGMGGNSTEAISGLITLKLLKEKMFILLCIAIFTYVGVEEGLAFWIGTYFDNTSAGAAFGTYALSGYWGSMIIGRFLASRFPGRDKLFLKGGLLTSLVFIILALLFRGSIASAVCFVLVGLGFSAIWPTIIAITADAYPQYSGTAMGIMMTCGAGGGAVVPLLMGAISGAAGVEAAFIIIPVVIVMILVVTAKILAPKEKRKPDV